MSLHLVFMFGIPPYSEQRTMDLGMESLDPSILDLWKPSLFGDIDDVGSRNRSKELGSSSGREYCDIVLDQESSDLVKARLVRYRDQGSADPNCNVRLVILLALLISRASPDIATSGILIRLKYASMINEF